MRQLSLAWLNRALDALQLTFETIDEFARLGFLVLLLEFFHISRPDIDLLPVVVSEAIKLNTKLLQVIVVDEDNLFLRVAVQQRILRVDHLLICRVQHVLHLKIQYGSQDCEDVAPFYLGDLLLRIDFGEYAPE